MALLSTDVWLADATPKKRARINSGRVLLCGFLTKVGGLPVSG
jgi:hypothetical protein